MHAIILSRNVPLTGTVFYTVEQGHPENTPINIFLSNSSPVAMLVGANGPTRTPYFDKYSYTLAPAKQATFEVTAYPTAKYIDTQTHEAFKWVLDITLIDQNRTKDILVKDSNGKPFGTTGYPGSAASSVPASFQAEYGECYLGSPAVCKDQPDLVWERFK